VSTEAGVLALELIAPLGLAVAASLAVRRREALLLAAAAVVLVGAGLPPMHEYAHRSVTGHMIQHLLLVLVAAPIAGVALTDLPGRWRARRPLRRATAVAIRAPHTPVIAGLVHALTMMIWHLPAVYDAALGNGAIHAAEHITMLGTATWWWSTVWHHARRAAIVAPSLSLFMVATAGAVLGVLMMFAPLPLYAHGTLADQQAAGALMAGGTGGLQMLAAIALVAAAIRRLDAPRPLRIPVVPAVLLAAVSSAWRRRCRATPAGRTARRRRSRLRWAATSTGATVPPATVPPVRAARRASRSPRWGRRACSTR
jgi:putative membrane protein